MSFNLTLSSGEDGYVHLWQTPTYITWMCLSYDPTTSEPDGGHEGVRRRYAQWVQSHSDGSWDSIKDLELERERIRDHLDEVMAVKNPHFSYI